MLSKESKQEVINHINERFKTTPSIFVLEYKGLTVKELENVRNDLRKTNSELKVVKNTLLKKAAENTEADKLNELFIGSTAIAFCDKDSAETAKVFVKSAKAYELLNIKGALLEGKVVSVDEIETISKLPSREELIAQFSGLLNSPMTNLLYALQNMQTKFLYALEALKEKKEK